jgi:hypothetical protein
MKYLETPPFPRTMQFLAGKGYPFFKREKKPTVGGFAGFST